MSQTYLEQRKQMVADQLQTRGISDQRVLDAFLSVPRHRFVPVEYQDWAYDDRPLLIGFEQTISQPYIVAYMTQALELNGSEHVLEVGTGSGYQTAILARLVAEVHTIELLPTLAQRAEQTLDELGITNIFFHVGDGSLGWPDAAPYDAIMVTAAARHVPKNLLAQLAERGRMILPVGESGVQDLELWMRTGTAYSREILLPVAFVPLRGQGAK